MEGAGTTRKSAAQRWFSRFNSDDLTLEDKPRSGRPPVLDDEDLRQALEDEPSSSIRELAEELGVSHMTVWNHLQQLNFV